LPISDEINQSFTATVNGNYAVIVAQGLCSDTSICVQIISIEIGSVQTRKAILVYPNPVSNEFIIEVFGYNGKVNFEIYNAIGQVVCEGDLIEKTTIQTSSYAPGVYLIKLEKDKNLEFKKIIKE